MLISIDHGNKQVKTIHHAPFTSGLVCSEVQPFGGETLTYQGRYYTLTDPADSIPPGQDGGRALLCADALCNRI